MCLIVYNFSMKIALQVKPKTKKRVWGYQLNFTRAFTICRVFIRNKNINVEQLLIKYILPIRPDRQDQRKLKVKTFTSFLYRVAWIKNRRQGGLFVIAKITGKIKDQQIG